DVRTVTTLEEYLTALEIDWEAFGVPPAEREERRAQDAELWPEMRDRGVAHHYIAYLDGRPVGFGRGMFAPGAVVLLGGAVLPEARGRGVYKALVRARWDAAVARGTPALVVQAGQMSEPILERLGFEPLGTVHLLVDELTAGIQRLTWPAGSCSRTQRGIQKTAGGTSSWWNWAVSELAPTSAGRPAVATTPKAPATAASTATTAVRTNLRARIRSRSTG